MIAVQNLPSMIGNRKTNSPDFPGASNEDSFGSQDMSNLTLRDRTRVGLSLNDLEPRKQQNFSSFAEFPSQSKLTDEAPQSTPTPTQILFPKNVTEEQEAYVRGFSQALEEIYRQHGPPASSVAKYVETTQHLEEKRTDPLTTSCYGQTWFYNDSKSSVFSASQVDQKPNFSQLNSNVYEPPFVPLSSYPTMVEDSWQNAQSSSHSNFSNVGQMFVSSSNDEVVVGSLPSTSFSSAGQKRNLSKMASQSLGSLTPSSIGSPCGSDVAVHSRAVAGEFATLDMEEQEKLRLERKRAKNRLAAQKCQMKKVERIKQLETRVNFLKEKNSSLSTKAATLRRDIDRLKAAINVHVSKGCRILSSSAYNSSDVVPPFT